MIYTDKIREAIKLAIKVHEVDQKQKRKGKDISYLTHPLTVGVILARASASEDEIIAGVLHDTIEDSTEQNKISREILLKIFGENVANIVSSVSEENKNQTWEEIKIEAINHIKTFNKSSVLIKSADVISNVSEIEDDHKNDGDKIFERFAVSKEKTLNNYISITEALLKQWPQNPLSLDLKNILSKINKLKES